MPHQRKALFGAIFLCLTLSAGAPASACDVPVFQYALERWPVDLYDLVVFVRGDVTGDAKEALKTLDTQTIMNNGFANYDLRVVDLDKNKSAAMTRLWKAQKNATIPWMVACYPIVTDTQPRAWAAPLSTDSVKKLLHSPLRKKIINRLLKGDTAVWVLLECGDRKNDDAAAKRLKSNLKKLTEQMKEEQEQYATPVEEGGPEPYTIRFPVFRLKRDAPEEIAFVNMLLHTEPDLTTFNEPIAFPIYGRGRALFALVGKGITRENIIDACAFLAGPCSCQAKAANPGMDILMTVNWDEALAKRYEEKEQADANPLPLPPPSKVSVERTVDENGMQKRFTRAFAAALIALAIIGAVAVAVVLIRMRKR